MFEWIEANQLLFLAGAIATILVAVVGAIGATLRYALKFSKWTGKVDADRKNFREAIAEIRGDVKKLLHMASHEIAPGSPLRLTDLGEAMSETLHGKDWARKIAKEIGEEVVGLSPYDVQEFCSNYVHKVLEPDEEQETRIKQCAYEHGVKREQVLNVLAIELRDVFLGHIGASPDDL